MRRLILDLTLRWANARRAELRLPPLEELRPGLKCRPADCPIARSIYAVVHGRHVLLNTGVTHLPWYARTFVQWFDQGAYPKLTYTTPRRTRERVLQRV